MAQNGVGTIMEHLAPQMEKYVVFSGAIVLLVLSGCLLVFAPENQNMLQWAGSSGDNSCYLVTQSLVVYLIALSILSLICLFYKDDRIIKLFTAFACFNILVIDAVLLHVAPRLMDDAIGVKHKLQDLEPSYDWTHQQVDPVAVDATEKWDNIQGNFQCCGLYSYENWDSKRPASVADDIYPGSCCLKPENTTEVCQFTKIYTTDCAEGIDAIRSKFIKLVAVLVWSNILLGGLGCILIYSKRKSGLPLSNDGLSRNAALFLFAIIAGCMIIQCIVHFQHN